MSKRESRKERKDAFTYIKGKKVLLKKESIKKGRPSPKETLNESQKKS